MSRSIIPSDEEVARLIAASCTKQSSRSDGSALSQAFTSKTAELPSINKSFLQNTIRSVESHNRREEVDECWRHYSLNKKEVPIARIREDRVQENDYDAARREWAKRKLDAIIGTTEGSGSSSSSSSDSDSDTSHRKEKKHKSSKDKKKKDKKSKSKKDKKKDKKKKKHRKQ